jgi:hypothetical protein
MRHHVWASTSADKTAFCKDRTALFDTAESKKVWSNELGCWRTRGRAIVSQYRAGLKE